MIQNLKKTIEAYVETKVELYKLDMEAYLKKVVFKFLFVSIILVFTTLSIGFLLIGLAQYTNMLLQSTYLGFLIFSFVCIVFITLLIIFKHTFFKLLFYFTKRL